jgi:hypothetical protein
MAATAIATYQTIWDCKWSRLADSFVTPQPRAESIWICIRRDGPSQFVSEEQCATCPLWEATDERKC